MRRSTLLCTLRIALNGCISTTDCCTEMSWMSTSLRPPDKLEGFISCVRNLPTYTKTKEMIPPGLRMEPSSSPSSTTRMHRVWLT